MPQRPAHPDPLSSLLADGAWLRRLATGLVGESGAEDLAQDVMVSAIKLPPQGNDAQLRSWAKTVARRLAMRSRERNRGRQHAEQRASKSEVSDQESEQRLLLYRRLTEAILALESTHRTVLVMRYMEDLTPQEIALRLEIAPATARKRLSRALVKLREVLDGEFGERAQWMHALGPMAFGAGWQEMLPAIKTTTALASSSVGVLTPIIALLTMKKLLVGSIVLCVALLVGMPALQEWLSGPSNEPSEEGLVLEGELVQPLDAELVAKETQEVRDRAPVKSVVSTLSSPQIHLVDGQGNPVQHGKGAWIDDDLQVHPLDFDDEGRGDLPAASLGSMCIVGAYPFAIEDFEVESVDQDIVVGLRTMGTLRGRLLVDGAPPLEPVTLRCLWTLRPVTRDRFKRSRPMERDQSDILLSLGLSYGRSETQTLPGGAFVFESMQPLSYGHIYLPDHLKVLPDGELSNLAFQTTETELQIETSSLPYVHGRLVWSDDGSPFQGSASLGFVDRRGEVTDALKYLQPSATGEFSVALEYLRGEKAEGLKYVAVRLSVTTGNGRAQVIRFPIDSENLIKDVGLLKLERSRLAQIRVLAASGEPVKGAFVQSTSGDGNTDSQGLISLPVPGDDVVFALAKGHGLGVLEMASAPVDSEGVRVIHLPEGNDLTITSSLEESVSPTGLTTFVRVDVPNGLMGTRSFQGRSAKSFFINSLPGQLGGQIFEWGTRANFAGLQAPIVLPGIAPGTLIKACLLDAKGEVLMRKEVLIPQDRSPTTMELIPAEDTYGAVEFDVVDDRGQPSRDVQVKGISDGWLIGVFRSPDSRVVVAPLIPGTYRFRVSALGRASKIVEVVLGPGVHKEKVVLRPGRRRSLRFEDREGVVLNPESVTLLNAAGEPIGNALLPKGGKLQMVGTPRENLQLKVRFGTRDSIHALPADAREMTVVLSTPGKLRVHFDEIPSISAHRGVMSLMVHEVPTREGGTFVQMDSFRRGASGGWDLHAALHPGTYRAQVLLNTDAAVTDRASVTQTLFDGQVTIVEGEEALIVVSGGKNPTATLTPPR